VSGRYRAHAEYQESGLDWLGRIPTNWALRRLGSQFKERRTKVSDADFPPLSVTMQGIVPQLETAAKTDDGDNRKLVRTGDFVINSRSDRKGSAGVSLYDGSVSLISIVLKPIGLDPSFVHHLLRSAAFQEEFYRFGKGIVADLWSTNYTAMKNIVVPTMPPEEQTQIAKFLDYETAKIDALIEKQQQLIALLKEKRQAVISHAVTKGLNPKAPMRDSGVEWLGEVPAHWETSRIAWSCVYLSYGFTNPMPTTDEGPYMLTAADISFDGIQYESARHTARADFLALSGKSKPIVGDLLVTKDGTLGRVTVYKGDHEVCISQSVALLRPDARKVDPDFLAVALSGADYQSKMVFDAGGTTIKHIYISILAKMNIWLPELEEQRMIVSALEGECQKLDELIQAATSAAELLQERRTALISAAVTGKIDVRGWKPPESKPQTEAA